MSDLDNLDGEEEVEEKERLRLRLEQLPAIEADTFLSVEREKRKRVGEKVGSEGESRFFWCRADPPPPSRPAARLTP